MPQGRHCTRTGHPLSAKVYFSAAFMISKTVPHLEWRYPECGQPGYLTPTHPFRTILRSKKK